MNTVADGCWGQLIDGVEKVTYPSINEDFKKILSNTQTSQYLTFLLPLSVYSTSGSVKIGVSVNDYLPNFNDGKEGIDYLLFHKNSVHNLFLCGVEISLPLSSIAKQETITSLSIFVKNMSGSSALVGTFASIARMYVL